MRRDRVGWLFGKSSLLKIIKTRDNTATAAQAYGLERHKHNKGTLYALHQRQCPVRQTADRIEK